MCDIENMGKSRFMIQIFFSMIVWKSGGCLQKIKVASFLRRTSKVRSLTSEQCGIKHVVRTFEVRSLSTLWMSASFIDHYCLELRALTSKSENLVKTCPAFCKQFTPKGLIISCHSCSNPKRNAHLYYTRRFKKSIQMNKLESATRCPAKTMVLGQEKLREIPAGETCIG